MRGANAGEAEAGGPPAIRLTCYRGGPRLAGRPVEIARREGGFQPRVVSEVPSGGVGSNSASAVSSWCRQGQADPACTYGQEG